MAKKEAKESPKKKSSNMTWIVVGAIVLVLILIIFSMSGSDDGPANEQEQPIEEEPASIVETLGEYPNKVVYKRVPGVPTQEYQDDCEDRGGRFNPCGNGCAPTEQICDASCYYICELT